MPPPAAHRFHPSILREYDIRGIVGETLSAADARAIGAAFGSILRRRGGRRVASGRDGRLSSPELQAALNEGLVASGCAVTDIGCGPTPMLYFAVHHLDADGGIQVTGSHNPPDHNGFKMMLGKASFYGEAIAELGRIAARGDFEAGEGSLADADLFEAYLERLVADHHGTRPVDAVWDAGNGAAGPAMAAIAARLPGRHETLFAEIDGRFPNHHPDPTVPENLEALTAAVRAGGFEVGIGFDGDGDRIGVVDGKGRIIPGDQILLILARDVLERHPGATIISDVKSSRILFDGIAAAGGRPLMWKTGHSLIKAKMVEEKAPLSGEMSGHIFYKDGFYGHDDALYVAVRLLDVLSRGETTLAALRDALPPSCNTPEIRFPCPDERKFDIIREVKANLEKAGHAANDIDGVRVDLGDGWWLLRASNTQAVLVARAEAASEAGLASCLEALKEQLRAVGVAIPEGL